MNLPILIETSRRLKLIKVGCVFPMVVVYILPHGEFGPNDHGPDTPHFTWIMSLLVSNSVSENFWIHKFRRILRENTVLRAVNWLCLVKMIYLYFIIYGLNRWILVIVLFQYFNTTLIILQSLNYSKLSKNLPFLTVLNQF